MIRIDPVLHVDGAVVATTAGASPVAVDDAAVTWGRASVLERPNPATAHLTVLDTSPAAAFASRTDLVGKLVLFGWQTVDGTSSGSNFRGRITDVDVTPRRSGGFFVDLACTSAELDAANYKAPAGTTFPAETMGQRLARIVALMPAGLFSGGVILPHATDVGLSAATDFANYNCTSMSAGNLDALSLLRGLWDSAYPVPLVYEPGADRLTWAPRRRFIDGVVGRLGLSAATGKFVALPSGTGLDVDSHLLEYAGALSTGIDSLITRVEVSFTGAGGADVRASQVLSTGAEQALGRRLLSLSSIVSDPTNAATTAQYWGELAAAEGAGRRLGPLTYRTEHAGGFASTAHAATLLAGSETGQKLWLGRSWLPRLGAVPVVGVVGGTVTYTAGEWTATLTPAPCSVEAPESPLTIAAAGTHTLAEMGDPLTFGDLAHVAA